MTDWADESLSIARETEHAAAEVMLAPDWLEKVRADLAAASKDDASRRVRCPVCQFMTRDIEGHNERHGRERCPECKHAAHGALEFCPNMASDNDCSCTYGAPGPAVTDQRVEAVARAMHDAYEVAARREGWETNPASRVEWADLPPANKATMLTAVAAAVAALDAYDRGHEGAQQFAAFEATLRERIARDIEAMPVICPHHGIPDCSPLLNGCSVPSRMAVVRDNAARTAREEKS